MNFLNIFGIPGRANPRQPSILRSPLPAAPLMMLEETNISVINQVIEHIDFFERVALSPSSDSLTTNNRRENFGHSSLGSLRTNAAREEEVLPLSTDLSGQSIELKEFHPTEDHREEDHRENRRFPPQKRTSEQRRELNRNNQDIPTQDIPTQDIPTQDIQFFIRLADYLESLALASLEKPLWFIKEMAFPLIILFALILFVTGLSLIISSFLNVKNEDFSQTYIGTLSGVFLGSSICLFSLFIYKFKNQVNALKKTILISILFSVGLTLFIWAISNTSKRNHHDLSMAAIGGFMISLILVPSGLTLFLEIKKILNRRRLLEELRRSTRNT